MSSNADHQQLGSAVLKSREIASISHLRQDSEPRRFAVKFNVKIPVN